MATVYMTAAYTIHGLAANALQSTAKRYLCYARRRLCQLHACTHSRVQADMEAHSGVIFTGHSRPTDGTLPEALLPQCSGLEGIPPLFCQ
jgi:hypothetical protein